MRTGRSRKPHDEGGKIALQILHAGRYGYSPLSVSASRIKSPITPTTPRELSVRGIERQIKAYVRCAQLAREAGYDGVEVRSEEHTSELQSLMRSSYAVFCLKKKKKSTQQNNSVHQQL